MSIRIIVRASIKDINKGELQIYLDSEENGEYYKDILVLKP